MVPFRTRLRYGAAVTVLLGLLTGQTATPATAQETAQPKTDVIVPPPPLPKDLKDPQKLREYAAEAKKAGDLKQAEEALRRILDQDPTDVGATADLGTVLLQAERRQDATALLEDAVGRGVYDPRVATLLGQTYLAADQDCCAMRWLEWAACTDPWTQDVYYYLGTAYLKQLYPLTAYQTLSVDGPVSDPQIRHAQTLTRGSSLAALRLFGEAQCLYESVEAEAAGTPMAEKSRELQCDLYRALCEPPRFRGTFKVTQRYDELPAVIPTTNVFGTTALASEPSWGNLFYAGSSYDLVRGYNDDVTIGSSMLHTTNYDESTANLTDLAVYGAYSHRGLWDCTPYTAGVVGDFDYLLVDSDGYVHRTGVTPFATLMESDFDSTSFLFRYTSLEFINTVPGTAGIVDPDSDNVSPGFIHTHQTCDRKWAFSGGYIYDQNYADGIAFDYGGHRALVGVSWLTPWCDTRVNFSTLMHFRDYQHSDAVYGVGREDDEYIFQTSVIYPLADQWFLTVEWFLDRNDSNLGAADYSRQVVEIGLQYNFGQGGITPASRRYYDTTYQSAFSGQ